MAHSALTPPLRTISLCSGIGGLDLGMARAGLCEIVLSAEHDPRVAAIHARHFPRSAHVSDVREVPAFVRAAGGAKAARIDCVIGGWPCQPHSVAGKGLGANDPRELWPAVRDVLTEVRPPLFVGENVPAMLGRGGAYFAGVLHDLAALGYAVEWEHVSAASRGAPHLRDRCFIVARLDGGRTWSSATTDIAIDGARTPAAVARRVGGWPRSGRWAKGRCTHRSAQLSLPQSLTSLWGTLRASEEKGLGPLGSASHQHRLARYYLDAQVQEFEQRSGRLRIGWLEWFMGFPAGWVSPAPGGDTGAAIRSWSDEPRGSRLESAPRDVAWRASVRGLGNAVCPPVAEWVGTAVVRSLAERPMRQSEPLAVMDRYFERRPDGSYCPKGIVAKVLRASATVNRLNMALSYRLLPPALLLAGVDPITSTSIVAFLREKLPPEKLAAWLSGPCAAPEKPSATEMALVERAAREVEARAVGRASEPCPCKGPVTGRAPPRGDLGGLHFALRNEKGRLAPLSEAMEVIDRGQPGADVAMLWSFFTTSTYASSDLPVVATREALQNSVDAIKAATRHRQIAAGTGQFDVTVSDDGRTISWADNGIGMDKDTIKNKFISLGSSGKREAGDSGEAAGGFGVAKAVILGISQTFQWTLTSRDVVAVAHGAGQDITFHRADAPRQGTLLVVRKVSSDFANVWDRVRQTYVTLVERLREMLAANDLPDITITLNGKRVEPAFSRRGGSRVPAQAEWGAGTTATVKSYRRPVGDTRGGYYIRLGGLFQFKAPARKNKLKADVVIDLTTTVRPGMKGYPLNVARDSLMGRYDGGAADVWHDVADELEREDEAGDDETADVFLPDSDDRDESQGAMELARITDEAFADLDLQSVVHAARQGAADFYREFGAFPEGEKPTTSRAAPTSDGEDVEWVAAPTRQPPGLAPSMSNAQGGVFRLVDGAADVGDVVGLLGSVLQSADQVRAHAIGVVPSEGSGGIYAPHIQAILGEATQHATISQKDANELATALEKATDAALGPGGGGLAQVVEIAAAVKALDAVTSDTFIGLYGKEIRSKPVRRNPFGRAAGLRVSKKDYDRAKAYRFRKGYAKWLPYLVVWDTALRLLAHAGGIRKGFKAGFVLENGVVGRAALEGPAHNRQTVVYINPDRFAAVVKAHKDRPIAIAAFLHGVGAHELTHADNRIGDGHDVSYLIAREDLGFSTGHLIPTIAEVVARVLRLDVVTPEQKKIRELEKQLAKLREGAAGRTSSERAARQAAEKRVRELERQLAARPADLAASAKAGVEARRAEGDLPRVALVPGLLAILPSMPEAMRAWCEANPEQANAKFLNRSRSEALPSRDRSVMASGWLGKARAKERALGLEEGLNAQELIEAANEAGMGSFEGQRNFDVSSEVAVRAYVAELEAAHRRRAPPSARMVAYRQKRGEALSEACPDCGGGCGGGAAATTPRGRRSEAL